MEDNNKNEMYKLSKNNTEKSNIELLNDLKNISSSNSNFNPPEIVKPKSSLAMQVEGLSFEEQKEMLNKMTASRTTNRYNEYLGRSYSLEDVKNLKLSVDESVKILINEAVLAPRMDIKKVALMVDDFYKSKNENTPPANIDEKAGIKKIARF